MGSKLFQTGFGGAKFLPPRADPPQGDEDVSSEAIHTSTVFLLHGLADSEASWQDTCLHLYGPTRESKLVLPVAPTRSVSFNKGIEMPAWFDIPPSLLGSEAPSPPFDSNSEALALSNLDESADLLDSLIDHEINECHIPADRIILAGFDQGGAAAIHAAYRREETFAGVVCLSGYLPAVDSFEERWNVRNFTPLLLCHGKEDKVANPAWAKSMMRKLLHLGIDVDYKEYEGMSHMLSVGLSLDVLKHFRDRLPPIYTTYASDVENIILPEHSDSQELLKRY